MGFFKEVEGEAAIMVENGIYKQVPIYTRDGYLYAKVNSNGFVRLLADGSCSKAKLRLDTMTWTGWLGRDELGRLCTDEVKGAHDLPNDRAQRLLGAPS